jgi:molybdenum cofactor sulfurtransferase
MHSLCSLTFRLAAFLVDEMRRMRHSLTDQSLCVIYGWTENSSDKQGPVVAFNLLDPRGRPIGFSEVAGFALDHGIVLRSGCFCNSGACQEFLGIEYAEVEANFLLGRVCGGGGGEADVINGRSL